MMAYGKEITVMVIKSKTLASYSSYKVYSKVSKVIDSDLSEYIVVRSLTTQEGSPSFYA